MFENVGFLSKFAPEGWGEPKIGEVYGIHMNHPKPLACVMHSLYRVRADSTIDIMRLCTVGFVVEETDDHIVLATHCKGSEIGDDFGHRITIDRKCIEHIDRAFEPPPF